MSSVINDTLLAIKAAFETGVNIFNGGTAVSSSNPLPTKLTPYTSSSQANYNGVMYTAYTIVSAVSGKYAAAQLSNPAGSGKTLLVYSCTAYAISTAGLVYRSHPSSELATNVSGITNNKKGAGSSVATLSKENLNAVPDTTYPPTQVTSTTPQGTGLLYNASFYAVSEGESLQFTHSVANCGMGIVFVYAEI